MGITQKRQGQGYGCLIAGVVLLGLGVWWGPSLTFRGVPLMLIFKFAADEPARSAYFAGQSQVLKERLESLGFEAEIEAFYRPKFQDEQELDLYTDQIFYNLTGFKGPEYVVDANGKLRLRPFDAGEFEHWFKLAHQAGVVVDHQQIGEVKYVISAHGVSAPYHEIAPLYPEPLLRELIKIKTSIEGEDQGGELVPNPP